MNYWLSKGMLTALLVIFPITGISGGGLENKKIDNNLSYLISLYCNDNVFLSAVGLNKNACNEGFRKYSEVCMEHISAVKPPIDINKNREQTFSEGRSFGYLYIMCIKANIYEEILNIQ
jgi:hypothetical protein